jgi:hypothetical protein
LQGYKVPGIIVFIIFITISIFLRIIGAGKVVRLFIVIVIIVNK